MHQIMGTAVWKEVNRKSNSDDQRFTKQVVSGKTEWSRISYPKEKAEDKDFKNIEECCIKKENNLFSKSASEWLKLKNLTCRIEDPENSWENVL